MGKGRKKDRKHENCTRRGFLNAKPIPHHRGGCNSGNAEAEEEGDWNIRRLGK